MGIVFFTLPHTARAADPLEIVVAGIEDDLRENVQAALALPPGLVKNDTVNLPWLELFREDIPEKVSEALEPFGYYDARAETVLEKPAENEFRLLVTVIPGAPVRVKEISIRLTGPGAGEKALQRIAGSFRLRKGDVLVHSIYEQGKGRLLAKAQELGYLDATFPVHEVRVTRAEAGATIALELDTGPRYLFGETIFSGAPQYPRRFLERYLDYRPGEVFSERKLGQTQINLSSSDRFKSVLLTPEREEAHDSVMPVLAQLTPLPRRRIRPGIGYGTDTGFRGSVRYKDVNLFLLGHELTSEINISERLQGIAFGYLAPSYRDIPSSLGLQLNLQREDTDTYISRKVSLEGTWNRTLERGQLLTVYLKPQWEDSTVGQQKTSSLLVLPGIRFTQSSYNDLIRPRRGYRYTLETRGTHQYLGSATGLIQFLAEGRIIYPLPWKLSLKGRISGGVTVQNEPLKELPASLRFYAGGDRSVRGYAYQSLGPKDETGKVIGGKNLLTASIELERTLFRNWGVAAFFDAGNAFNSLERLYLYKGAGIGARYYTPIGALQLDVAREIGPADPTYRIHFSVGVEL